MKSAFRSPVGRSGIRPAFIVGLTLALVVTAVYSPVVGHRFVDFDDTDYILENRHVRNGLTVSGIIWAFSTFHEANWHPLTWLSHMLDVQLFGLNAGGHHLTSLLLHVLNCLLLFGILARASGDMWPSAFVAALFGLHPLHVESVAWAAERKDVLSTFFWMLAVWGYLRYVEKSAVGRYAQVALFFLLGLMAKPMVTTLPLVLLLLDIWPLNRMPLGLQTKTAQRAACVRVLEKMPLLLLSAASALVTFAAQNSAGAVGSMSAFPLSVRMANTATAYTGYMVKMLWPLDLYVPYMHPGRILPGATVWAVVALTAITLCCLVLVRRAPFALVGWLWYLGTLLPVIGLIQVGYQAMADRYTYVPLIGLFIIVAWGGRALAGKGRRPGAAAVAAGLFALIALTVLTGRQVRYWQNGVTLFSHTVDKAPANPVGRNSLGLALTAAGRWDAAIAHLHEAVRLRPDYYQAYNNLGLALDGKGQSGAAIRAFRTALAIKPDFGDALYNLGHVMAVQGRFATAVGYFRKALSVSPQDPAVHVNLGVTLMGTGHVRAAAAHFQKAVALDSASAEAHNNLGFVRMQQGWVRQAIAHFTIALEHRPRFVQAQSNLETARAVEARIQQEIARMERTLGEQGYDAQAMLDIGRLYRQVGDHRAALDCYRRALALEPDRVAALLGAATLYREQGNDVQAIEILYKIIRLDAHCTSACYDLAAIYARRYQAEASVRLLKRALASGFDDWQLLLADGRFDGVRNHPAIAPLMISAERKARMAATD